ncbi:hypothetical protein MRB53_040913 [Persea americana]|nr:hypothetical protein MRB53_040913 [Persea americana]
MAIRTVISAIMLMESSSSFELLTECTDTDQCCFFKFQPNDKFGESRVKFESARAMLSLENPYHITFICLDTLFGHYEGMPAHRYQYFEMGAQPSSSIAEYSRQLEPWLANRSFTSFVRSTISSVEGQSRYMRISPVPLAQVLQVSLETSKNIRQTSASVKLPAQCCTDEFWRRWRHDTRISQEQKAELSRLVQSDRTQKRGSSRMAFICEGLNTDTPELWTDVYYEMQCPIVLGVKPEIYYTHTHISHLDSAGDPVTAIVTRKKGICRVIDEEEEAEMLKGNTDATNIFKDEPDEEFSGTYWADLYWTYMKDFVNDQTHPNPDHKWESDSEHSHHPVEESWAKPGRSVKHRSSDDPSFCQDIFGSTDNSIYQGRTASQGYGFESYLSLTATVVSTEAPQRLVDFVATKGCVKSANLVQIPIWQNLITDSRWATDRAPCDAVYASSAL